MTFPIPITPTLTMDMHGNTSETVTQGQVMALQAEVEKLEQAVDQKIAEFNSLNAELMNEQNQLSILRGRFLLQERERLVGLRQKAQENAVAVGEQKGRWV